MPMRRIQDEFEQAGVAAQLDHKARYRSQRAAFMESFCCCDTVTEQVWSQSMVVMAYTLCVAYVLYLYERGDFVDVDAIEAWGVSVYVSNAIYIILMMLVLIIATAATIGLCFGNNTNSPYWHSCVAPMFAAIFFVVFVYDPMGVGGNCRGFTCFYLFGVILGALLCIVLLNLLVAMRVSLPSAISRRHYAFRYVKELLSDRRSNSDQPQARYEATRTAWKRQVYLRNISLGVGSSGDDHGHYLELQSEVLELRSAEGIDFGDDLVGLIQHQKQLGATDRAILDSLYRLQHSKLLNLQQAPESLRGGGGPEVPDLQMKNQTR